MCSDCDQHPVANIVNGSKVLYTAQHDHIVDLIAAAERCYQEMQSHNYKHCRMMPGWLASLMTHSVTSSTLLMLFLSNPSLVARISELGYECRLVIMIFGSLGHIHTDC